MDLVKTIIDNKKYGFGSVEEEYEFYISKKDFSSFEFLYKETGVLPSEDLMINYEKKFGLDKEQGELYSEIFDKYKVNGFIFLS